MLIKNGTIYDAVNRDPYTADIRVTGGKISEIGPSLAQSENEPVIDAKMLIVTLVLTAGVSVLKALTTTKPAMSALLI